MSPRRPRVTGVILATGGTEPARDQDPAGPHGPPLPGLRLAARFVRGRSGAEAEASGGDGGGQEPSPAVLAYVEAVNGQDLDGLVQAFAPDAVITDVSRKISRRCKAAEGRT